MFGSRVGFPGVGGSNGSISGFIHHLGSVSVAKLVNATVHATGTGGQTTLDSFLAAAGLHIKVRTNSVHCFEINSRTGTIEGSTLRRCDGVLYYL